MSRSNVGAPPHIFFGPSLRYGKKKRVAPCSGYKKVFQLLKKRFILSISGKVKRIKELLYFIQLIKVMDENIVYG